MRFNMGTIDHEIRDWFLEAEDLGKIGCVLGDSVNDIQRKKLSLYITHEVMTQCQEISETAKDLQRSMEALMEYTGDEDAELQKVKKYPG